MLFWVVSVLDLLFWLNVRANTSADWSGGLRGFDLFGFGEERSDNFERVIEHGIPKDDIIKMSWFYQKGIIVNYVKPF